MPRVYFIELGLIYWKNRQFEFFSIDFPYNSKKQRLLITHVKNKHKRLCNLYHVPNKKLAPAFLIDQHLLFSTSSGPEKNKMILDFKISVCKCVF